jgi:hypothetical protein
MVLQSGAVEESSDEWWSSIKEVKLEKGERVIGIKSGFRGEPFAYHFDL